MIIVFVIDNYNNRNNGTSITANRFKKMLEKEGHEVRVVTNDFSGKDIYTLQTKKIPIASRVAKKQGYTFAKPNKKILKEAFNGANIIHFFTPWKTTRVGLKLAKKMNIPTTIAFHIPPESITYGAGLKRVSKPIEYFLYKRFKKTYKKVRNVHCPSNNIATYLKKHRYPNQLHIISNGVGEEFQYLENNQTSDKFKILSIGRYATEKNQKTIIKAISKSKYKNNIELTLAGHGPLEDNLKRLAKKLNVNVKFAFYNKEELIKVISKSHLYIHSSIVETEGLSCLEAISSGRVPIIAYTKKSAASQFALDERSIYKGEDYLDLKNKMEYWISNEEERKRMEIKYSDSSEIYKLSYSITRFINFLKEAIKDHKNEVFVSEKTNHKYIKKINKNKVSNALTSVFYYIVVPILMIYNKAYLKVKFINKKHIKKVKGGAVIISNHVHNLDSVLSGIAAFPKKVIFTSIKSNFELKGVGFLVKALGTLPIPDNITETRIFFNEISKKTRKGKFVHFFPEGELIKGDTKIRSFKEGAFKLAVDSSVPIVPIRVFFKETKKGKNNKRMIVIVGKPLMPDLALNSKMAINKLMSESAEVMNKLYSN